MQLALTVAALAATASASFAVRDVGVAKVVNRCSYPVYLWSIDKELGCGSEVAKKLSKGEAWDEPFRQGTNGGGISIKISKWNQCGGKDQTQLEYKIENSGIKGNFLDMSFVDCQGGDCPGWKDGFYMASGRSGGVIKTSEVNNEHCPVFAVANSVEAAKVSYVQPNDRQTKFCAADANLDLYLCGSEAPGAEDETPSSSAAPSSSKAAAPSLAKPSTTLQAVPSKPASSADEGMVKAAAVTSAPAPAAEPTKAVKTVITYVTVSVDAPMHKRHAHGRRHNHA